MRNIFATISFLLSILLAAGAHADCLKLRSSAGSYELCKAHDKVLAKDEHGALKLDPRISAPIDQSDDFFAVDAALPKAENSEAENSAVIYVRIPSAPNAGGRGYCGAGDEDYMLLVERKERSLRLLDRLLIQSCLKNISLASDQGYDPRHALKTGVSPVIASFDLLLPGDSPVKKKQVILKDNKLLMLDSTRP
ncbi:hypothetical protein [Dyella tabacisoli]|uniref:Uncharacterized protein n=1 Tax=Dyella tabacisoli TaxID=2282381 RepID=A0A369UWB0_9GAMM|nr:hypothetical protein [Dyella tabacisoli]RDD82619.1 hypothetical protein DVJ77_06770 [Dyella tabacisoli]